MSASTGLPDGSRSSSEAAPARRSGGFTLIEVLVAFAVLSLTVAALIQAFSGNLRNVDVAEDTTLATLVAESTLAGVGEVLPLREGEWQGEDPTGPGFRWRVSILPYDDPQLSRDLPVEPYRVVVTVTWGAPDAERSLSLATLRLAAPGP